MEYAGNVQRFRRIRNAVLNRTKAERGAMWTRKRLRSGLTAINAIMKMPLEHAAALLKAGDFLVSNMLPRIIGTVGDYKTIAELCQTLNQDVVIGYLMELRLKGFVTLSPSELEILQIRIRSLFLESAHLVDGAWYKYFPNDFLAIGIDSAEAMPAVATPSGRHTLSMRRALERLIKSKGGKASGAEVLELLSSEGEIEVTRALTAHFKKLIGPAGKGEAVGLNKAGKWLFDPKSTKPSEVILKVKELWAAPSTKKIFELSPQGFDAMEQMISALRAKGR